MIDFVLRATPWDEIPGGKIIGGSMHSVTFVQFRHPITLLCYADKRIINIKILSVPRKEQKLATGINIIA